MSEAQLLGSRLPVEREPRPQTRRPAEETSWRLASPEGDVTAYDDHWYRGRPQRP